MSETDSAPDATAGAAGLNQDEHAELERLRTEVDELRQQQTARPRRRRVSWRTPVSALLIVIGCILAPLSVIGVWTANQVSDTNRYVANIEPLIHDPAIQNALTDKVTTAIVTRLDVAGRTNQAADLLTSRGFDRVGSLLKTFSGSLASAVTGYVHNTVHRIVTSERFANAWVEVNRTAHQALVQALSGSGGAITVSNGQVTLDLAPFIAIVKQDLVDRGFTLVNSLPPIHPTIALFSSKTLVQAQTLYRVLNDLKIVLPIVALVLIAAGVYIARDHRRALIGAGLGFAASMLVLGAALLIFRAVYLNSVPNSVFPSDAAAAAFDTLVRFIREALRALLVLGLVVAIAAFMSGPSVSAVRTRAAFVKGFDWLRSTGERRGVSTGPAGRWTYAHRHALRICAVGLAAVIFVFQGRPSAASIIVLVIILLLVLGLIELIGRPPAKPEVAGQPG
ncbi:MAG: hypothetical protein J2P30_11730 [Actinobacteria bacterium]|nr:hypothetical protein [Actinomycetota bacterium]